jgi:hypothetical protein
MTTVYYTQKSGAFVHEYHFTDVKDMRVKSNDDGTFTLIIYHNKRQYAIRENVSVLRIENEKDKPIFFDDFVEDGYGLWSQVCKEHAHMLKGKKPLMDAPTDGLTCGVNGCDKEAIFYVDSIQKEEVIQG